MSLLSFFIPKNKYMYTRVLMTKMVLCDFDSQVHKTVQLLYLSFSDVDRGVCLLPPVQKAP